MARPTIAGLTDQLGKAEAKNAQLEGQLKRSQRVAMKSDEIANKRKVQIQDAWLAKDELDAENRKLREEVRRLTATLDHTARITVSLEERTSLAVRMAELLKGAVVEIAAAGWPWLPSGLVRRARRALADLAILESGADPEQVEPTSR